MPKKKGYDTDDSRLNDSVNTTDGNKPIKDVDISKYPRPCFYTAVTITDVLVFSIPLDLIDKLPHDVYQTVKENLTQQKLDMLFTRLKFLHKQSHNFMKYQGKMKDQEINATFKHIKSIYPVATTEFQAKMRSDSLKKSQMNPKILMMKKNERIDRNNTIHKNVEPGTIDMFRSENPRVRRDASRFLEKIRDPFTKFEEEN